MLPSNHDRMNGPDFFFSPSATIAASTGNSGEDDDWGEFVDSSDVIDSLSSKPNGFFTDRNGSDSAPNRIESEDKNIHAKWVTSRGPVPLSVFGEEEDDSGASVSSFDFSFDSFSSKRNNGAGSVSRVVNTNPIEGISSLIPNLCRESCQRELTNGLNSPGNNRGHLEMKDKESLPSRRIDDLAVSMENLNWNPLSLDTENSEKTSSVVNSNAIGIMLDPNFSDFRFLNKYEDGDDDVDDWKFKTAESMYGMADGGYKEGQEKKTKSGSVVVQNTTNLSSSVWSLPTNGTGRNFEDAVESVNGENGDDDPWDNGGWEFKVAEVKNDLTNKESNGWSYEFGSEPVSKIETTTSLQSNFDKEPQKRENDSISLSNTANVNSGETSWAFKQPSLENGNQKEEKEVQKDKPKGLLPLSFFEDEKLGNSDILVHEDNLFSVCDFPVREKPMAPSPTVSIKDKPKGRLPLSFFEDEKLGNSDILVHEDNLVSVCDFPVREKPKAPSPTVSINDLITSLYSQVENNAVNLSEKPDAYGFVTVKAETDSNLVNGEDDSWEFQGPKKTITDSSIVEGIDGFDNTWEFQGPSLALKNTVVTEDVDEFDDDSWEFQGPTQPVKDSTAREGDNGSLEYKRGPMENDGGNTSPVSDGFQELHEKPVISIEPSDYQDFFLKLRTELYDIALHHLETLKDARDMGAEFVEALDNEKRNSEIDVLQNWLNNDVLRSEVNLESLQPKSSGITELSKALQEPKFQAIVSEDGLSERLLLAGKDWKSTIELLKHATLTLKILNLGSPEQQSEYASTWFVIASACAQELRHAASIWKQVIENDVQEEILSKPQGKSYILSVGEIYRVVKILRASIRLYKPWIILNPSSYNVLAVLDECVKLWSSSGLEEALRNSFSRQGLDCDYSADQFLKSIKFLDEVDAFTLHTCITSAKSPTCYISGLNTELLPGIKMLEWNGNHYLLPLANLWANLISRDPPSLRGHHFPTIS